MLTLFFQAGPVRNFADAAAQNQERFAAFHAGMLDEGIYWPPSMYEALFLGASHSAEDIDSTVAAAKKVLAAL